MKLYLIDGSGYIHRAFHAIRPLSTASGTPVNAVYGVAKMVLNLLLNEEPKAVCVCYDMKGPTFRHELFSAYKANRQAPPEDLVAQFPLVHELITAMGLFSWEKPGYEADDLLGTLAEAGHKAGHEVVIVSADKDLAQLVGPGIELIEPTSGHHIKDGDLVEKLGVYPHQVVDYLALVGDSSDNIPGVPKIGAKTAAKLLSAYGSLDAILEHAPLITPPSVQKSLMENQDKALLSRTLATICRAVPEVPAFEKMAFNGLTLDTLVPFLKKLEMRDLLARVTSSTGKLQKIVGEQQLNFLLEAEDKNAQQSALEARPKGISKTNIVTNESTFKELLATIENSSSLVLETVLSGEEGQNDYLMGLVLKPAGAMPSYIPLAHSYLGMPPQLATKEVLSKLMPLLAKKPVIGHYNKRTILALLKAGSEELPNFSGDTMLAAYLLDPEGFSFGYEHLAQELLGAEIVPLGEIVGQKGKKLQLKDLSVEQSAEYFGARASGIAALHELLAQKVENSGMGKLYHEIELPLAAILAQMEYVGVKIDR